MFTIDSNQVIRITRGDDSGDFELFVNAGSALIKRQKELYPSMKPLLIEKSDSIIFIRINNEIWNAKTGGEGGAYLFYYTQNQDLEKEADPHWELDGERVNLEDYGIVIVTEGLQVTDSILIEYNTIVEEVQLIVYEINKPYDHFLFKKTFKTDGTIICENKCGNAYKLKDQDIVKDGNIYLSLDARDTKCLRADEYRYIVRGKFYDPMKAKFIINTLIGEKEFYIIER